MIKKILTILVAAAALISCQVEPENPELPQLDVNANNIETDMELGAIIRGMYDYDSGDWAHRYIVKSLTAEEMVWVAKDDKTYIQKFKKVDSIPVAEQE